MGVKHGLLHYGENVLLKVLKNRALRKIFGSKSDKVTGDLRNLRNEELHDVYFAPALVRMINSRRVIWVGHVPRVRRRRRV
jgi:hypothetical protein